MKRSIKSLEGFSLKETDGEIGKVDEFYFDDVRWAIRYLVVKTGNWLSGRDVLISPKAISNQDWENEVLSVNLTQEQIKNSPDIDTDKPVSRQHEEQLFSYYSWDPYWGGDAHGAGIFGAMPSDLYESEIVQPQNIQYNDAENQADNDPHLRSTDEVKGYAIHATDGEIGKVADFILDDSNWKINYLVVDTGGWLNSKNVLLPVGWIKEVKLDKKILIVDVTTAKVENCPSYDPSEPIDINDEKNLFNYYGKPHPNE